VVTAGAKDGDYTYAVFGEDSLHFLSWPNLAHPLTPLYPVPDPDDDKAVGRIAVRTQGLLGDRYLMANAVAVRAGLRALRASDE
jgi:hypothetical protein